MNSEKLHNIFLIVVFLAVGSISWFLQFEPALVLDSSTLNSLPREIRGWRAHDIPLEGQVEAMLNADFNLQRAYSNQLDDVIWLYIGYYGTARGGKPEHTPEICYNVQGWHRTHDQVLDISPARGLRVNEYTIEKEGEQRLVLFWFQSSRATGILGTSGLTIDHLMNRLSTGHADGALVRVSTPIIRGKELEARSRLVLFAEAIEPLIAKNWPTETKESAESKKRMKNATPKE